MSTNLQSNSNFSKFANIEEYEAQSFEKRRVHGISVDRSSQNLIANCMSNLMKIKNEKDSEKHPSFFEIECYASSRELNSWHTKRQANAKIVDLPSVHEQLIDLARPVLLDLFMSDQPTAKDLKNLSDDISDSIDGISNGKPHEKTVRRRMNYFANVVGSFPGVRLKLRNQDGSIEIYPKFPDRKDQSNDDKRLKSFVTNYSLPSLREHLDTKDYVDFNYFIRLKKFWKDMLFLLEEILNKYQPIQKEMDWLVYHIVNNDVGLHVLFDDLSLECELKWFHRLKPETQIQIAGTPMDGSEPYPFTPEDAKKGISELRSFVQEFETVNMPTILNQYKISQKIMRRRIHEMALESADEYHRTKFYGAYNSIMDEIDRTF